jgi:hypothetical protein
MKHTISLDQAVLYRIAVQGHLDSSWSQTFGLRIAVESGDPPVTLLTGEVDQAALHGVLRKIYSIGLPLLSVRCIEPGRPA